MDLNKLFTPAAVAANFIESTSSRVPYLGSGLFQPKKKAGLDLSWVLGANGLPVSLAPSTLDSETGLAWKKLKLRCRSSVRAI